MASIRSLKKDIDFILSLTLEECIYVAETYPEIDEEKINGLAGRIITLHRDLRARLNHIDGKENSKLAKEYIKKVVDDLYSGADGFFDEMTALIGKKQPSN